MEAIEKTPEKLVLRMEANENLANTLRRSISEIPILAIDEVEIVRNDSALFDEVLAHRLGLLPLKTEKSMSGKTRIDLKLSKTGPGMVYSGDFKGGADIVYDNIPMVLLEDGAKIELVATAILGKGIEHSKFNPGFAYYRHLLEVKGSPKINEIVQNSKGVIKPEKKGDKWICDLNENEVDEISKIDKEAVKDGDEILLFVESYGNMSAVDVLAGAIEALDDNLDEFEKFIK